MFKTSHFSTFAGAAMRLGAAVGLAAVLGGCASTITSISLPSSTPWRTLSTTLMSPYKDLIVTTTGVNITATLAAGAFGAPKALILCNSSLGKFVFSSSQIETVGVGTTTEQLAACVSRTPPGATNVSVVGAFYPFTLGVTLGDAFVSGGVEISSDVGNLYGVALTKNSLGKLGIAAGVSPVVFGGQYVGGVEGNLAFQVSSLTLSPPDQNFGPAQLCADGTSPPLGSDCATGPVGGASSFLPVLACIPSFATPVALGDVVSFYTGEAQNSSLMCGSVPIGITMNKTFASLGQCVDTNIKQYCTGLTGRNRAACNHTQAGACQATFNVPSALNPNK